MEIDTMDLPNCPKCASEYTYDDGINFVCPECAFEWNADTVIDDGSLKIYDAHGTQLQDGDDIIVIKDLKVKGASQPVKLGTKVKNIKLVNSDHNIDCRIDGFGAMSLKSEFVKKA